MPNVINDTTDFKLVFGVSRPKIGIAVISMTLLSLFLTFVVFYNNQYDSFRQTQRIVKEEKLSTLLLNKLQRDRRLPDAIIIGVRKCGTRALLDMLYLHPMIDRAPQEVHYFDDNNNYNKGVEWYKMQMPITNFGQITIEKTPSYFTTPEVPKRIKAMNPSIKLILLVREPVNRAISDFTQLKLRAISVSKRTRQAEEKHQVFEELAMFPNGSININYPPVSVSIYNNYIDMWLEEFPRKQILLVNGDTLIDDPLQEVRKVERFLGVEAKLNESNIYFNKSKGFYCFRDQISWCLNETKGRKHKSVDPLVVSRLRKFYAEHNQKFYRAMGKNLGWPEE